METLYEQARKLLRTEYETNRAALLHNQAGLAYADEKWRHSLQVAGAGNLILRHEKVFARREPAFLETAKIAILLHDVYRFREVRLLHETGQKIDHGLCGAELLSGMPEFDDLQIVLPVKHHGHMIEDLYADPVYQSLPESDFKTDLKHIAFAVRDADKIANWQILTNEFEAMRPVWLPFPEDLSDKQGSFDERMWPEFCACKVIKGRYRATNAEVLLSTLCWIFDVNYKSSVQFCKDLKLFEKFYDLLIRTHVADNYVAQIRVIVRDYVKNTFGLDIS